MPHTKGKYIAGQGFAVKSQTTGVVTEVISAAGAIIGDIQATAGSIGAAELASDAVETAKIKAANVTLAKLAAGITPSHVIKFAKLGSTITTTALAGLAVGDLVIRIIAADGTVTCKPVATVDTLPDNPEDADYVIVIRAAA